ncbi:glycerol kinase [Rhodovastum atsumiense]|uniref:Glycerol kinase n=1 Tax=Rhodovastum atsumiense TaxID=504468 RepID=A0A5M6IUS1_9PROT|nr:glycerol kinase GlpK [Rhodovastum atsumiense]KAA5612036.1 glycerol kinase GlpK [Rhodovastum atsumiense]CAH2604100.1 glycerol kinase [Rhodovastum atsumiense]
MPRDLILALDQGTTSTRTIAFRAPQLAPVATARRDLPQHFPASGWVEHDPEELFTHSVETLREAMAQAGATTGDIAAIGITNQRETTLVWDRATGRPIHKAIVWQDRRTAPLCAALREAGHESLVTRRSGLLLDPYFSATKLSWLLDNVAGAREAAAAGRLAFGTVDTWLLWRLTGGRVHATDATNASRTLLMDITRGCWDPELLDLFRIPAAMLPEIRDSAGLFGVTEAGLLGGEVPVMGIAGDQQAATVGQACFRPGMVKSTYGTGCFLLLHTGDAPVASRARMLTTIALQMDGKRSYALEGAIFVAGAAVQWLRDGLGVLRDAAESGSLAANADPQQQVYMVPAFTGLGAPHWDSEARGALFGLTRATGPAELARAALESVAFQTRDLIEAMRADWTGDAETVLRVDGGMVASDWTMQFLANMLGAPVDRPVVAETTALGAAYLAGFAAGVCPEPEEFARSWALQRRFVPRMDAAERDRRYDGWRDAVRRTLSRA